MISAMLWRNFSERIRDEVVGNLVHIQVAIGGTQNGLANLGLSSKVKKYPCRIDLGQRQAGLL